MSKQDSVFINVLQYANQVFVSGVVSSIIGSLETSMRNAINPSTLNNPKIVPTVKRDAEKEYMDIPFEGLAIGQFYLVKYKGETYAFKRTPEYQLETYDVMNG